jgi:hypothetical protein
MDEKWEPGLQSQMHQPPLGVLDVKVQVQTLARDQVQFQQFGLAISVDSIGPARFHAPKDGHQALLNAVLADNLLRLLLFGGLRAGQVDVGAPQSFGLLLRVLTDLGGQSGSELLEVLEQHFGLVQVFSEDGQTIQNPKRPLQSKPVKTMNYSHDILPVLFYKRVKGVV